jgi:hypothetical protein
MAGRAHAWIRGSDMVGCSADVTDHAGLGLVDEDYVLCIVLATP